MNRLLFVLFLLTGCVMCYCTSASAANKNKPIVTSLCGIKSMGLVVEDVAADVAKDGLSSSQIQSDIEQKLRSAGIAVLSEEALPKAAGMPYLYCNIFTYKDDTGIYAYHITLELKQMVCLIRKPALKQSAATWKIAGGGIVGINKVKDIRDFIEDYADKFITAYKTANQ
jgi:hypothetical protein